MDPSHPMHPLPGQTTEAQVNGAPGFARQSQQIAHDACNGLQYMDEC